MDLNQISDSSDGMPEEIRKEIELRRRTSCRTSGRMANISDGNIRKEIESIVDLLGRSGHEVVVCDLTHPDLGIPVVRVVVPGLQPPIGEGHDLSHPCSRLSLFLHKVAA